MIGMVLVSHSRPLAEGVRELVERMTHGRVQPKVAAGVDDPIHPLGTDPIEVRNAIQALNNPRGVLVLTDIGSSILSAQTAVELLEPEVARNVHISRAALVEGALAAAVAIASGQDLAEVEDEALRSLQSKQELNRARPLPIEAQKTETLNLSTTESQSYTIWNQNGLHARPAASIITLFSNFACEVQLIKGAQAANARSLTAIAGLAVSSGDTITLLASGPDAKEAVEAFSELVLRNFRELIDPVMDTVDIPLSAMATIADVHQGLALSEGVAWGPIVFFEPIMPEVPDRPYEGEQAELQRIARASSQTRHDLRSARAKSTPQVAEILRAHELMIEDPELNRELRARIQAGALAEQAWLDAITELAATYGQLEHRYMRDREADVWDVGRRMMAHLTDTRAERLSLTEPSVVFAQSLSSSDVLLMDRERVLGLCLAESGQSSHSAILIRALGIPSVAQLPNLLAEASKAEFAGLDGSEGLLWLDPKPEQLERLKRCHEAWRSKREADRELAQTPAVTASGRRVQVFANIGGPGDVPRALADGAEGVGLLRTEHLFQESEHLPSEDEQFEVYVSIAKAFQGLPITIRSLDAGGDKPLPNYPLPRELNPALGLRGIRLCLADPPLFKTQLRALLRAVREAPNIRLMIPMVSRRSELLQTHHLLQNCRDELQISAKAHPLPLGAMVEVPSAAFAADEFTDLVSFFSLGTNDLTQYLMGADRSNHEVTDLVDYRHPVVLRAIEQTCAAAKAHDLPVSICGELAADTRVTSTLLALGVESFSVAPPNIPGLKAHIRSLG